MGWWSSKVMGGDYPLDMITYFARKLGIVGQHLSPDTWHGYVFSRELLQGKVPDLIDVVREQGSYNEHVAGQALAVLLMRYGVSISQDEREFLLRCARDDEWAYDAGWTSERGNEIRRLIDVISEYDGVPVDFDDDEGLFGGVLKKLAGKVSA